MFGGTTAIQSQNIVGYAVNTDMLGKQYVQVGTSFLATDASDTEKSFKLKNIRPISYDSSSDMLQVISDVNARTLDVFTYVSAEEAEGDEDLIGWWDSNIESSKNELEFKMGVGFKANFAAKDVALSNSGVVNQDATEIDYTGKQYVVVPNILPRKILLGEIVGIGTDSSSDMLQVLSSENAKTVDAMVYVSAEEAEGDEDLIGWWDSNIEVSKNTLEIEPNGALYANFAAKGAKLAFPSAVK